MEKLQGHGSAKPYLKSLRDVKPFFAFFFALGASGLVAYDTLIAT